MMTESKEQLRVAADTIQKDLDPLDYREVVATCQTNITCLDCVKKALVKDPNFDIKQVEGKPCQRKYLV